MSSLYEKEKRKITILLVIGLILTFIFLIGVINASGFKATLDAFTDFWTWFILVMVTCYPLGIFYGWREMLRAASGNLYSHTGPADRYYTVMERNIHKNNFLVGWVINITLVICFGWIFGTITAFKRLNYFKKNEVEG